MRLGGWAAGLCGSRAGTRRTHPPRRSPHTPQPRADAPNQKAYLRTPVSTPVTVRLLLLSKRRIGHMIHEPLSHVAHECRVDIRPAGAAVTMRRIGPASCDPRARWARWRGSRETPLISRAATVHSVADLSRRLATVQSPGPDHARRRPRPYKSSSIPPQNLAGSRACGLPRSALRAPGTR